MRATAILLGALLASAPATGLTAQDAPDRPDFSGTWTRVAQGDAAGGTPSVAGLGQSATMTQTDSTLTLVRTTQLGQRTSVYNLDGTSRANTLTMGEFSMPQTTRVEWAERTLVITTTTDLQGTPFETTMRLTLSEEGTLTVVAASPGLGGGAATEETATYTKG